MLRLHQDLCTFSKCWSSGHCFHLTGLEVGHLFPLQIRGQVFLLESRKKKIFKKTSFCGPKNIRHQNLKAFMILSALNLFLMFFFLCVYSFCQMMDLNTTQIGLTFLVCSLLYALVTPLSGWIGDKTVREHSEPVLIRQVLKLL